MTSVAGKEHIQREPAKVDLNSLSGSVHLIGIGGIGMSALARLLLAKGISVSGSDREETSITKELSSLGAKIMIGHKDANCDDAGLIIVSTAITDSNPEYAQALKRAIPVWHRSQLLAYLSKGSKLVAVSGTHGKTTTTGIISEVLLDAELDPSIVVGGIFGRIKANGYLGGGDIFVAETDESDGTHSRVQSHIAVITNIEAEHLENYPGGLEQIRDNMVSFASGAQKSTVICLDDAGCRLIRPRLQGSVVTYGSRGSNADYVYSDAPNGGMKVCQGETELGTIDLKVPGVHNKLNALCALVVGLELGLSFAQIASGLSAFAGVNRRFQVIGQSEGVMVVDDYAHHPTEVQATLNAANQFKSAINGNGVFKAKRVVAIFQPHQPGRLRDLWEEFCSSFEQADLVLVTDIYVARGSAIEGITADKFVAAMKHANAKHLPGPVCELPAKVCAYLQPGDLVLTIGAGDITKLGLPLLDQLKHQKQ
jgi:UDP-N-acetylmuramate--alanine ligase